MMIMITRNIDIMIRYNLKSMTIGERRRFSADMTDVETLKKNIKRNKLNTDNYQFYYVSESERYYEIERIK